MMIDWKCRSEEIEKVYEVDGPSVNDIKLQY